DCNIVTQELNGVRVSKLLLRISIARYTDSQLTEEFSQEREDIWKARLAELAINPHPLKISQNMLTSKRLYYSKQLTQLLETKDVEMKTNGNSTLYALYL
ncbi:23042_t:CDS:2, partial [Rhizophagus irregularis]